MLEVCIDNIEDIKLCNKFKDIISRVELNQALLLGGLTPSLEFIKKARKLLDENIQLVSMIRLRSGDFNYTKEEFNIMYEDAKKILKYTNGIVFGALNKDFKIDIEKTQKMIELCKKDNKDFVFHRAIDVANDYFKSIDLLENMKVKRILTSGHEKNAVLGLENIRKIKNSNVEILVGCGINEKNISEFQNYNVHGSFSKKISSSFGDYTRLDERKLEKLRETKIFKKSNIVFIHGAGITGKHLDGSSLYDFTNNPNLVDFRYNEKDLIKKELQNFFDLQLYGDDAVKFLDNYEFSEDDIKYVCGHSVGAYNVLKAFSRGLPQNVDLIELGAPRIDEIEKYIDAVALKSKFVLIELIEDDKLELSLDSVDSIAAIQYGDRSVKTFEEKFKERKLPQNVFVLKISKVIPKDNSYLSNVLENHSNMYKKGSKINNKFQMTRREIVEIVRAKQISYNMKLKKIKEIVEEYNKKASN
ncbi:copper homeostasis protein CutC [Oceanivirga miroungae]|uniref:Copper homeostasis protein cutC homolog n=1 Tax=Oceanivirga miroungae TaxID=1130046 RepID=A0A6I8M8J5_9FUSO|nr:copper homeostasis protein CutC [Oceanivirga miroungae]VWL85803.1 CutC family protein [Oceanivirga miroungae]